MIYLKNTNTNQIEQFSSIPSSYYGDEKETFINENGITCQRSKLKGEYIELTENDLEVQENILLPEIKEKQIALIKEARDNRLNEPHLYTLGKEVICNEEDQTWEKTGNLISFYFSTKATNIPLTEPSSIMQELKNLETEEEFLPYSCDLENGTKGYVGLDKAFYTSAKSHLRNRAITETMIKNKKKDQINSIFISETKTFEQAKAEIEAITFYE